jgi:hypothetical protein
MPESEQIYAIRTRLDKITSEKTIDAFWMAATRWESLNPEERELLKQTEHSFKAYQKAHGIDHTEERANPVFFDCKERYEHVFLPLSRESFQRREAGTTLPIYYAKPTEGNITRAFYIHIGGTNNLDLQTHVTDSLVKSARVERVTQSGNFVFVQSNVSRSPTEIEEDKILKSLGFRPEVISLDYLTKAKA